MFVLLLSLPLLALAADPMDTEDPGLIWYASRLSSYGFARLEYKVMMQGTEIFEKSRVAGVTVRQCSCGEQRECVEEMKAQAKECTVPCFASFKSITERPDDLRKCFEQKDDILQNFLSCFENRMEACVDTMHGKQIDKTDIASIFNIGQKKIVHQTSTMQAIIAPIKHIVEAAGEFAVCVKDCFIAKNSNGFCFDKKGCQPLVMERKAKSSFRTCTRKMNWKREAGEFCDCSVNAGVTELRQYCGMFSLMGKRKRTQQ